MHGQPPRPPEVKAPSRASAVRTARPKAAGAGPARAVSRVTVQDTFRPYIIDVLRDAGGQLDTDSVMQRLAERMHDVLLERDRQVAPGGEVRWQTAARKERKAMIDEGLVVGARPGVWQLTEEA